MPDDLRRSLATPYLLSAADVIADLGSDPGRGLTADVAARRLAEFGPNELKAVPPIPKWRRFLSQFTNPLVLLLLGATVISALAWLLEGAEGLPYEALAIIAIVVINALIGYFQEARAEEAVEALKKMTTATATVLRDGQQQRIPSSELAPGDIIFVEEGDAITADCRLFDVTSLQMSEASLTGESQAVTKAVAAMEGETGLSDRANMIYSGTIATFGRGRAIVTGTGMATEMGKIAGLMQATPEEKTPLSLEIDDVGRKLGIGVILIAVIVIGTILLVDNVTTFSGIVDTLILGVSLAVAAVPEGLPTILTVVLSLGVQRMAKRHAIVRKLAAVETLGSASVICSDKTGTLTKMK